MKVFFIIFSILLFLTILSLFLIYAPICVFDPETSFEHIVYKTEKERNENIINAVLEMRNDGYGVNVKLNSQNKLIVILNFSTLYQTELMRKYFRKPV